LGVKAGDLDALEILTVQEKGGPDQVNHSVRQGARAIERQAGIGEIHREKIVVLFHVRAKQQRTGTIDAKLPPGHKPRALMKQPLVFET
jgi:hypothetical protein